MTYGIQNTEMIGFWDDACPVKTNHPDVRATVYQAKDRLLIALASWVKNRCIAVTLTLPKSHLKPSTPPPFRTSSLRQVIDQADALIPIPAGKGLFLRAAP